MAVVGPFQTPWALVAPEGKVQTPNSRVEDGIRADAAWCVCVCACVPCASVCVASLYLCVYGLRGLKELARFLSSGQLRLLVRRCDASCNLGDREFLI